MKIELDKRLKEDTFLVADLPLSAILLMNNALYPWLILVPRVEGVSELIDLSEGDRIQLMKEISFVSEHLKDMFAPDKLNVASLGNQVSQLHVHIIGRYEDDKSWPNPVWGGETYPYSDKIKDMMMERLEPMIEACSNL